MTNYSKNREISRIRTVIRDWITVFDNTIRPSIYPTDFVYISQAYGHVAERCIERNIPIEVVLKILTYCIVNNGRLLLNRGHFAVQYRDDFHIVVETRKIQKKDYSEHLIRVVTVIDSVVLDNKYTKVYRISLKELMSFKPTFKTGNYVKRFNYDREIALATQRLHDFIDKL